MSEPVDSTSRRRLDSWKEIAAFLGRDVRTAKRWENDEGLPVHRHRHKSLASVYAYEDELEAWRTNRQQGAKETPAPAPSASPARGRVRLWMVAVAVVVVGAAAATILWMQRSERIPFGERDWALITLFENRTGEAVFDGSVEYALERELTNSQFVNVVPRDRVLDALRLMRKPPHTVVDRDVGREVCLRDGGISALISGRVDKLGGTYLISADVIDPATGVAARSFSEEAAGQQEVVRAIGRLSDRVREGLGEELSETRRARSPERSAPPLERVSTPSLRALQLYSQADSLIREHKQGEAAAVLSEAVWEDPDFASAHVLLAHALVNLGRDAEARSHFDRAFELAETTTDRERLFIVSSWHSYRRNDDKKIETLEMLLRLYPDHYWATSNLAHGHLRRDPRRAVPYVVRRADLRPNNFDHQLHAAHVLLVWGDRRKADAYAERGRLLIAAERDDPVRAWRSAWVRLYPVHARWVGGGLGEALDELNRLAAGIDSAAPEERTPLRWEIGSMYLNLGKERAARQMFAGMTGGPDNLALIALALEDTAMMSQQLQIAPASHRAAILFARAGLPAEAEKALRHPEIGRRAYAPFLPGLWDTLARGELAMARRERAEAVALLKEAVPSLHSWPTGYFFLAAETLSRALEEEGDQAGSIAVLEDVEPLGVASVFWGPAPLFWMKNELRRAELYRGAGREEQARKVEGNLARLMVHADGDFFVLRELRRRGAVAAAR
ncbi:MAG TPA: hypothetical protein VMT00_06115 [Thermoanaerobaculia bacterium]|nr:hypothetical protein [Thermoanaerobaculia bacterium]